MGARFFHWLSFLCNKKNRKSEQLPTKAMGRLPKQVSMFSSYRLLNISYVEILTPQGDSG